MLRMLRKKKGQNTAEYAILIALVIAVAIGMQTYTKRGIQGRVKDSADDYVTAVTGDANWATVTSRSPVSAGSQYEIDQVSRLQTQTTNLDTSTTTMNTGGDVSRDHQTTTQGKAGDYQQYDYK